VIDLFRNSFQVIKQNDVGFTIVGSSNADLVDATATLQVS